jgi:protein-tyrosine phosphatase
MEKTRVLFVCLGNICRSPMAEGIFRKLAEERGLDGRVEVDSAGTGSWHVGEPPDPRARHAAARHGVDISTLRGRQVTRTDFERFDYVVAMDRDNLHALQQLCPQALRGRLHRCTHFAGGPADVPDPYYGGPDGFEQVYHLIRRNAEALLDRIAGEKTEPST